MTKLLSLVTILAAATSTATAASNGATPTAGNAGPAWTLDPSWPVGLKGFPKSTKFSAVALITTADGNTEVHVSVRQNSTRPIMAFDAKEGNFLYDWGDKHISNVAGTWGAHGLRAQGNFVWVADIQEHTVKQFDARFLRDRVTGALIATVGTPNNAGGGTEPLQFGNCADVATAPAGPDGGAFAGGVWVSDGDGGILNRVARVATDASGVPSPLYGTPARWALGGNASDTADFHNPHSVAFHAPSGSLVVADRANRRLALVDAATGTHAGAWTCPGFGPPSTQGKASPSAKSPWGVRSWKDAKTGKTFLAAAVAGWPADGTDQYVVVYEADAPDLAKQGCKVVAQLPVDPKRCLTPHELEVDRTTGDIYLTCVTTGPSTVVRFNRSA